MGTDGAVREIEVLRSLDPNGLDASAIEAFRQWTFEPGTRLGQPVAVVITAEMAFTLRK